MFELLTHKTLAPLVLRLGLAVVFIFHGLGKVNESTSWGTNWDNSEKKKDEDRLPWSLQVPVAYGELLGGIALGIGFLTRLAALGIAVIMAGAIATVHWPKFDVRQGGFEYSFALLIMCVAVFLVGGGVLSLDRLIFARRRRTLAQKIEGR